MPRRAGIAWVLIIAALSGCATTRLYSEAELNTVASRCGLAAGDLVQEADYRKMLFVYRVAPTPVERVCAYQWARPRNLRMTVIEAVTRTP